MGLFSNKWNITCTQNSAKSSINCQHLCNHNIGQEVEHCKIPEATIMAISLAIASHEWVLRLLSGSGHYE